MAIATVNPASGETVKTYDEMSEADLERALAAAAAAAASYRLTGFDDRAEWMRRAAGILDSEQDQIAAMMTTEMGKTLVAAGRRSPSAPPPAGITPTTPPGSWPTSPPTPAPSGRKTLTSATSRSDRCWPSCRGISRCGRPCASPPRP